MVRAFGQQVPCTRFQDEAKYAGVKNFSSTLVLAFSHESSAPVFKLFSIKLSA
jgi:hypothetical protein